MSSKNSNALFTTRESPIRKKYLIFGSPLIGQEEIREVIDTLKSGWLGTGPKTHLFEQKVNEYIGSKYANALNSCTAGLHLALLAVGVKPEDEVITTPLTFAATANVIEHIGAKPIFADVQLNSMNIDPSEIEKKITKKTKAIIPVHFAGRPCDMDAILKVSKKYHLRIIEDAAHAFGAIYKGKKIGTIGDITVFSFYVTKNLMTGEGGMVTTNNPKYSKFMQIYSLHGLSKDAWKRYSEEGNGHYLVEVPGYKYNMMDIQASLGIHQLAKFDASQKRREEIWNIYNQAFSNLPIQLPSQSEPNTLHAHHLYTIFVEPKSKGVNRDLIRTALSDEGIGTGVHFVSLHLHPYYKNKYKFKRGDFPNSEYISDRIISLPLSAKLKNKDISDVIKAVKKVIKHYY